MAGTDDSIQQLVKSLTNHRAAKKKQQPINTDLSIKTLAFLPTVTSDMLQSTRVKVLALSFFDNVMDMDP
jgi:hypothetical protein